MQATFATLHVLHQVLTFLTIERSRFASRLLVNYTVLLVLGRKEYLFNFYWVFKGLILNFTKKKVKEKVKQTNMVLYIFEIVFQTALI